MSFEWSFRYFVVFPVIRVFLVNEGTGFYMMATIPLCDVAVCTRFRIKKMNCRSSSIGGSHIEQIALPPLAGGEQDNSPTRQLTDTDFETIHRHFMRQFTDTLIQSVDL